MSFSDSVQPVGDSTSTLVLVPTQFELDLFTPQLSLPDSVRMECCGFGVAVSGAVAMQLIDRYRPADVQLIGIAGSLGRQLDVGKAVAFSSVSMSGIGAGQGGEHQSAESMGWRFWDRDGEKIATTIQLTGPTQPNPPQELLTVCSASANAAEADQRRSTFPNAVAEDMESFAVAAACTLAKIPLSVVRGISNVAGDRDKSRWLIDEAIAAVAKQVQDFFNERDGQSP